MFPDRPLRHQKSAGNNFFIGENFEVYRCRIGSVDNAGPRTVYKSDEIVCNLSLMLYYTKPIIELLSKV